MTFGCAGCDARWGGLTTSHCSGCHITTTCLAAHDKHRFYGKCRDPISMGLVDVGRQYPCFGFDEEE